MHVSHEFCLANGIQIHVITQLVNIEGLGDAIKHVGYAEDKLSLPMGSQKIDIEALLLVLPTTKYQKRMPVAIDTTITDMAVDFINQNKTQPCIKTMEGSVLCYPFKKNGTCTAQSQGVY